MSNTLEVMQVNGSVTECPANFSDCQTAVDGYIEVVNLPNGDVLLVNEEGVLRSLLNPVASLMAGQTLVGPVVYIPKALVDRVLG